VARQNLHKGLKNVKRSDYGKHCNSYKIQLFTTKNIKKHRKIKGKKGDTYPLRLNLLCRRLSGLSLPVGVSLRSAPEVGVTYTGVPIFLAPGFFRE
jgi:hypothetical protein